MINTVNSKTFTVQNTLLDSFTYSENISLIIPSISFSKTFDNNSTLKNNLELEKKNNEHPELREAHKRLAKEIITFLHGEEEYNKAVKLAESLFNNKFKDLSKEDIVELFGNQDTKEVKSNVNIIDFITEIGAVKSKREAREFITNGAISINGEKVDSIETLINDDMFIDNTYIVVKRGKKNYYIGQKIN